MPHPIGRNVADKVLVQLIEADVEIGFGLLDEAKAYRESGNPECSSRILQVAAEVIADIEHRLQRLGVSESGPFVPLLGELRNQIAAAKQDPS